jgi:Flp pilus assembly protein TadG
VALTHFFRAVANESGAELIEFALVLPVFLLVTVGIIDFAFVFQQYNVVTNAAREGARLAAVPDATTVDVENRVKAYIAAGGLAGTPATGVTRVSIPTHPGGPIYTGVRVTVAYPCTFMALGPVIALFGSSIAAPTLHVQAAMRAESQ